MHTVFILAAGLGTRLRPLTEHIPKPLVPVCGVPMLTYALSLCARHGLTDVVVNAHYLPEQVQAWSGAREGVTVTVSHEPDLLGTGGGLKKVARALAERFVILNADVLNDVDLTALLAAVPEGGAAMALRPLAPGQDYRVVASDATGTVVELRDLVATTAQGAVDASTHFTGVHALHRDTLGRVPEGFSDIVRTAYLGLVVERRVRAVRHDGLWLDVGDPRVYLDTNLLVLSGAVRPSFDPMTRCAWGRRGGRSFGAGPPHPGVTGDAWVGGGARIEAGASLTHSIVGAGAHIASGAHLDACVVWDGVRVGPGRYRRAVLYPGGVLGDL